MSIFLSLVVVLATVGFIGAPLWWRPAKADLAAPGATSTPVPQRRRALLERRDTLLGELKELEFDRRMDKIDSADYEALRASTAAQASVVLQELALTPRPGARRGRAGAAPRPLAGIESVAAEAEVLIARARRGLAHKKQEWGAEAEILVARARRKARPAGREVGESWTCASCGRVMAGSDRFCASCGAGRG